MDSLSVLTSVSNSNKSKNKIFKKSSALTVLKKKKANLPAWKHSNKMLYKILKNQLFFWSFE